MRTTTRTTSPMSTPSRADTGDESDDEELLGPKDHRAPFAAYPSAIRPRRKTISGGFVEAARTRRADPHPPPAARTQFTNDLTTEGYADRFRPRSRRARSAAQRPADNPDLRVVRPASTRSAARRTNS
jgi:hypothetical protein